MSILDFAASTGWAMEQSKADQLIDIAARYHEASPQALEAYRAQALERSQRAKVRDGTAILYVEGPLFKKANLFVEISGATSYEILARDFQVSLDSNEVHSIAMMVDSPGGEANGCDQLASMIYAARGKKPITAYVSGMAASGGYWLASAADKIVVSDAALLGSIGVVLGMRDDSEAEAKSGRKTIQFVSSQSPGKRPDPKSDEGRSQIQTMVDDMADVFIAAVAQNRGISAEDVVKKFGAGGLKVGAKAVAAGMADSVGSFESAFLALNESGKKGRDRNRSTFGGFQMSDTQNPGPSAEEIASKARTDAQTRMKAILTCDDGKKLPTLAAYLAYDTNVSSDDAGKMLAAGVKDMPVVTDKPAPAADANQQGADHQAQSFTERKAQSGALGLGAAEPDPKAAEAEAVAAGWGKAAKNANASLGIN